jgi:hypothetical protein
MSYILSEATAGGWHMWIYPEMMSREFNLTLVQSSYLIWVVMCNSHRVSDLCDTSIAHVTVKWF